MPITEYLTALMIPLLKSPEALKIVESQDQMGILLSVDVHKDDMGVVVGKAGETAKAIRHLVRIVGIRANARVSIKINEPYGSIYPAKT
jgi:predicted RNA-binding protein YlqC (UPF0109 family)